MGSCRWLALAFLLILAGCGSSTAVQTQAVTPAANPGTGTESLSGYMVSAWFPDYDLNRAALSLNAGRGILTEVNPVWFILNSDGSIKMLPQANEAALIATARDNGMKVIPTVMNFGAGNFNAAPVVKILSDATLRMNHARSLAQLVKDYNYDGIEIDYEGLPSTVRSSFTALVRDVRTELPDGKLLSLDVYSKTTGTESWNGPGAECWEELLPLVDRFKIMIYDYSWSTGKPGPIAPLNWTRNVLKYAVGVAAQVNVTPKKIMVGMPFYGWDWPAGPPAQEAVYQSMIALKKSLPVGSFSEERDPDSGEIVLKYLKNDIAHIAYYQDAQTLSGRLAIIRESYPQVGGISFWRLGGEDPNSWPTIQNDLGYK
ncbi:MAG TPA: glycosyl hydrolase family 18 protein [Bacillota bacterium]|nr:glycosyl hydrolase family 18 protein [Bacillota bacterium]